MLKRGLTSIFLFLILASMIVHAGFFDDSFWQSWFTGEQILTKARYETSCFDHQDNDGDKKIDCDDTDCRTRIAFPLKLKTFSFRGKTVGISQLSSGPFRVKVVIDGVEKVLQSYQEVLFESVGISAYLERLPKPEDGEPWEYYLILGGGPLQTQHLQLAEGSRVNFAGSNVVLQRIARFSNPPYKIIAALLIDGNPLYFVYHDYYNRNDAKGTIEPWTGIYVNVTSIMFSSPKTADMSFSSRTCTRKFAPLYSPIEY